MANPNGGAATKLEELQFPAGGAWSTPLVEEEGDLWEGLPHDRKHCRGQIRREENAPNTPITPCTNEALALHRNLLGACPAGAFLYLKIGLLGFFKGFLISVVPAGAFSYLKIALLGFFKHFLNSVVPALSLIHI